MKLRGFRIEIGEIEAVLTQFSGVREAAVALRTDVAGGEQLVAYVVPEQAAEDASNPSSTSTASLSVGELRSFVRSKLPSYMAPGHFVVLEQLPLNPNGKVDRRALPSPDNSGVETENNFVAPATSTERTLAEIWADILQLPRIGTLDNFFDLGGHSLLATALIFRIRQAFAIDFPLRYLFEAPTVAALSRLIEALQREVAQQTTHQTWISLSPQKRSTATLIPLSLSQEYMWRMQQGDQTGAGLNSSIVMRFNGVLRPEIVERSVNEIVHRHEILRTVFTVNENTPMQRVIPDLHLPLVYEDLQRFPPETRESEAINLGLSIGQRPFDLSAAALLRVALFRLNPQEHWLLITMHHIITDGWSFGLFLQELDSLIQAYANKQPSPLPVVSLQYADFALWQRQVYNEAAIAQQLAYWQGQLVVDSPNPLPSITESKSKAAGHYFTCFPESLAAAVESWSRAQGVTGFVVLLTGLKLALAQWTQQQEILVVATVGNRTAPGTEQMIGCFINDVILRSHLSPHDTGLTFLQQLQATVNEAIEHKEAPLQQVIEQTKRRRPLNLLASITMTPSIQTADAASDWQPLNLQPQAAQWDDVPSQLYTIGATETTPLELYVELSKTIRIVVNYSTEQFTRDTVEQLFGRYQTLLASLIAHPKTALSNWLEPTPPFAVAATTCEDTV